MKAAAVQPLADILLPPSAQGKTSDGNHAEHLRHDGETLERMWESLEKARSRVWLSMFNLAWDSVGQGTIDRMTEAARRGCAVCLLYDHLGSNSLRSRHLDPLRQAGGRVEAFHHVWPPWRKQGQVLVRNHRKLLILDEDEAYCGSMNLTEQFTARERGGEWLFDDSVMRLCGPCVRDLGETFRRTWQDICGENLTLPTGGRSFADGVIVETLETDPRRPNARLQEVVGTAIRRARSSCRLTTPYFVPPDWLSEALLVALRNGADVQILTAGHTDAAVARLAGRHSYRTLLRAGARIFEMKGQIIHAKKVTVDDGFCTVGSYNMDVWTSRHVLDLSVAVLSAPLVASLNEEFYGHVAEAEERRPEEWRIRGRLPRAASLVARKLMEHL